MAARLLSLDGKTNRAAGTLESAWKAAPHPALYLAYRDLRTDETPRERAARLVELAGQNPTHRESRILHVERALIAGDAPAARAAARALEAEPATARIAGLMARVAFASGAPDEARVWMAKGMSAPHEPDWSDLDPEGHAFGYHASDWARLVATFAETGELIHPRLERQERSMSELPELPLSYADSAPFLTADGHDSAPFPIDEGHYGDEEPAAPPPPPAPQRRSRSRRRLASAPRAAK
jgi:HemY protein